MSHSNPPLTDRSGAGTDAVNDRSDIHLISPAKFTMRLQILLLIPLVGFIFAAPYRKSPYLGPRDGRPENPTADGPQLLTNGTRACPWWPPLTTTVHNGGPCCVQVAANSATANLTTTHSIPDGGLDDYVLNFTASATSPDYSMLVQAPGPPVDLSLNLTASLTQTPAPFSALFFLASRRANATLLFQLAGDGDRKGEDVSVCIGNVSLTRAGRSESAVPAVKVNRLGYFEGGVKIAGLVGTRVGDGEGGWALRASDGKVVASGPLEPRRVDAADDELAEDAVVDFSDFRGSGQGFTLVAGGAESAVFDILPSR
ncbi:hypothetical protein MBLNU230_g3498t1 [Neophaeotheca triangularis]